MKVKSIYNICNLYNLQMKQSSYVQLQRTYQVFISKISH